MDLAHWIFHGFPHGCAETHDGAALGEAIANTIRFLTQSGFTRFSNQAARLGD